ncbi:MAG: GAF domain-containing protein [Deltaproteobacteria bacterium]|nr:GAF domain-containing protein [Deltaproteobacteria bacterium]
MRQAVCKILKKNIPYYNWVGFYLSDGNETLILHEFEGEPTIHTKIRYGEGICGQAAVSNKTFLVPDVTKEQNYLSCSVKVKSEIVVPLLRDGNFSGELDIDSHTINAFDENDRIFLEKICDIIVQNI